MLGRVHDRGTKSVSAPVAIHRNAFHIPGAQGAVLVQQSALHHGGVGDEYAVVPDERVHPAQTVLPVFLGKVAFECLNE
ncbi:hypothetical protein J108_20885 [Mycobacteroides abscessus subsp. bolletii CRM-0020]|uniref:Uncharacterized protein n=1 Tax=Mycobacteroides abscessus subsp. bolletii CRM-0020 TaxID=1306401 RepID=A0A829HRU6_9MYCO|nr:hypothetical protein MYCMA_04070 [Mycobacteroides abscessus subsp. massiliense str. GO 06]AMU28092.1 hypothetical protein A3N96_24010 [Mycobacteroides abscessus]EPQ21546.1 hypothetical protein J108_20885 [Mycobacteroides abscessus subsp. bolletii CRM-0020]AMU32831.1 hypothetical protein A3N97_21275 [Mycobacteroides abscessus]AMU37720.1 hypothetical protein A3N98_22890 [Mycobacteroides abscessus]